MVLDHSGPALGAILYGSALKLFVFNALVAHVVLPPFGSALADAGERFRLLGRVIGRARARG